MRPLSQCPQCTRRLLNAAFDARSSSQTAETLAVRLSQHRDLSRRAQQFSTSTHRSKASAVATQLKQQRPVQPSLNVLVKRAQEKAQREGGVDMSQVGILPETYIRPTDSALRRQLWWYTVKKYLRDRYTIGSTYIGYRKLKPRFDYYKIPEIAAGLHERLYKAFAKRNLETEREVLCEGLANRLKDRVASRDPLQDWDWEIVSRHKPKLVSYMATALPDSEEAVVGKTCLLQAVVRIRTVQRLRKTQRTRKQQGSKRGQDSVAGHQQANVQVSEKDITEYLVLQKHVKEGKEQLWKIWGFTQESTLESIAKDKATIAQAAQLSAAASTSKN